MTLAFPAAIASARAARHRSMARLIAVAWFCFGVIGMMLTCWAVAAVYLRWLEAMPQ